MTFLEEIKIYKPYDEREQADFAKMSAFIEKSDNLFSRTNLAGHITASACVVNKDMDKILLVHHKVLDYWLMPGGHADGSADILAMAKQEVAEETGVDQVDVLSGIFDIDVHSIPMAHKHGKDEPEHTHYDIRYLLQTDESLPLTFSERESNDVRWVEFDNVLNLHPDWVSGARMIKKIKQLKAKG